MSIFYSTYLWNFDKMHLNSSVWTDRRGFSGYRISEHGHWYFTGDLATLQRINQADFHFCSLIIFEMSNRSPLFWPFHAWLCKNVEAAIFLFFNYLKPRTCLHYGIVILNCAAGASNSVNNMVSTISSGNIPLIDWFVWLVIWGAWLAEFHQFKKINILFNNFSSSVMLTLLM